MPRCIPCAPPRALLPSPRQAPWCAPRARQNRAGASGAAASSDGSVSSSVRSSRQAALREIGVEPAFANSAAVADSASERTVAIFLFLLFLLLRNSFHPSPPQKISGAGNDHTGDYWQR